MVGLNFFFSYIDSVINTVLVSKQYFMVPTNTQDRYGSDNGQHFILSDGYYWQLLTPVSSFVKDYGEILLRHHNLKGNQKMCVSSDC